TAALTQAFGWNVLSDDMSILSSAKQPTVWSTARGVSLWPESRKELMLPDADCHPVHDYDGKIWYAPPPRSTVPAQPLNSIVFLSRGSPDHRITLHRPAVPTGLVMAASQLVRFNPRDRAETARLMADLKTTVEAVPTYVLSYPQGYDTLPRV